MMYSVECVDINFIDDFSYLMAHLLDVKQQIGQKKGVQLCLKRTRLYHLTQSA